MKQACGRASGVSPAATAWYGLPTRAAVKVAALAVLFASGLVAAQERPSLQGLQNQITDLQRAVVELQEATYCATLPTAIVRVPMIAMGAYLANGSHLANLTLVGQFLDGSNVRGPYRSYFVYDLRLEQPGPLLDREDLVVAGELVTYNKSVQRNGIDGFRSDTTDTLTLTLNRLAWMDNDRIAGLMAGNGGVSGFVDLADGPVYGHYVASAANNGIQFNIRLSDMAVRDLNRTNGGLTDNEGRLLFAIGGAIQLIGIRGNAFFLGGGVPYATLELKVRRYAGTGCPMPTESQYQ